MNIEIGPPRGEDKELEYAVFKRRAVDHLGQPFWVLKVNQMLNTRSYKIEYIDGAVETVTVNLLAENILDQFDERGHHQLLFSTLSFGSQQRE